MKKIKIKFRRLLFYVFKEEIMNVVKDVHNNQFPQLTQATRRVIVTEDKIDFEEIKLAIIIETPEFEQPIPAEMAYQEGLRGMKKQMAFALEKYLLIDSDSVIKDFCYAPRKIEMSLFVGKRRH